MPSYDLDGNLTNDGRWIYTWNGENRLISMTPTAAALSVGVPNVLVTFAYDYLSRRIGKTIVNRAVTPHSSEQISYLYDHWNPVAEWRR
ncbi:MAG: RHS repeat-associated core domain-containing protein, partial [Verrucomicrobia bacterium]